MNRQSEDVLQTFEFGSRLSLESSVSALGGGRETVEKMPSVRYQPSDSGAAENLTKRLVRGPASGVEARNSLKKKGKSQQLLWLTENGSPLRKSSALY